MNTRIKELRKHLKLTQAEFGARIGVKGNTVTNYESGFRTPVDAVILSICREFGVSESWLRYGEGDMFVSRSQNEEIAMLVNEIMSEQDDSFRKRFIASLSELGPAEWEAVAAFAQFLISRHDPGESFSSWMQNK